MEHLECQGVPLHIRLALSNAALALANAEIEYKLAVERLKNSSGTYAGRYDTQTALDAQAAGHFLTLRKSLFEAAQLDYIRSYQEV